MAAMEETLPFQDYKQTVDWTTVPIREIPEWGLTPSGDPRGMYNMEWVRDQWAEEAERMLQPPSTFELDEEL